MSQHVTRPARNKDGDKDTKEKTQVELFIGLSGILIKNPITEKL